MPEARQDEQKALEGNVNGRAGDEEFIDIDLDEEDVYLREAVGQPVLVKVDGSIISVPHMMDWEHEFTRMVNIGDFDGWAQGVLTADDYKIFKAARLRNYQIEKIVERASKRAGTTPGKSSRSSNSRRSTARR